MVNKSRQIGELLADDSFVRWLDGTADSGEASYWEKWKVSGTNRDQLVREAHAVHGQLKFKRVQRAEMDQELIKLNSALDNGANNSDAVGRLIPSLHRRRRDSFVWSVAAVFLVCMMISGMVYYLVSGSSQEITSEIASVRTETVETGFGETRRISFSDGSVIMINGNSVLSYSILNNGRFEAEVDGEAWFDISPSASRRVSVHTEDGSIHVLGTQFNVSTYREGTAVVLKQGSVQVEIKNSSGDVGAEVSLTPGTMASMIAGDNSIHTSNVDPVLYTSWTQNRLRFDETPFTEVKERIKDIYGLEVRTEVQSDPLLDIRISGSVPNDNIEVLLKALEGLLGRSASIHEKAIIFSEG